MSAEPRGRRGKKGGKRPKKGQPKAPEPGPLSNTIFDSVLDYVNPATAAGVGVTVLALAASAVLIKTPKKRNKKSKKKQALTGPNSMKFAKSAPMLGSTPGGPGGANGGDDKKPVSLELVSKMFQSCLQARPKDQKLIMEEFHRRIKSWNHEIVPIAAQPIIVNFLFWYFRMKNSPINTFTGDQADYIRYWADYKIDDNLEWSFYNLKFDFMYSIAFLQRSIPHMRQFWKFIASTVHREQPKAERATGALSSHASGRKKDNYNLTRYQAACILGKWKEAKFYGDKIKTQTKKLGFISQKDNYMLNYALRAMEMPQSNANFGQIHQIVDTLIEEYPTDLMPPARYGKWQVHSFKYRNRDSVATPNDDSKFVIASINMKDKESWYHFYPPVSRSVSMARIPREIKLWGRIAQMMSPMNGLSGCLPMTGTWSDLNLYMEMEWTYKPPSNPHCNRKKHGVLRLEREPIEEKVSFKDFTGRELIQTGYKWKGTLVVTIKDEEDEFDSALSRMKGLGGLGALAAAGGAGGAGGAAGDAQDRARRIEDIYGKREDTKTNGSANSAAADSAASGANALNGANEAKSEETSEIAAAGASSDASLGAAAVGPNGGDAKENDKSRDDNEEVAVYDIELVIETDIKTSAGAAGAANGVTIGSNGATPTENGVAGAGGPMMTRGGPGGPSGPNGSVRTRGSGGSGGLGPLGALGIQDVARSELARNEMGGLGGSMGPAGPGPAGPSEEALKGLMERLQKSEKNRKEQQEKKRLFLQQMEQEQLQAQALAQAQQQEQQQQQQQPNGSN